MKRIVQEEGILRMPYMKYSDHVGKDYYFEKGERIPQWLFENGDAVFGCDCLIIPLNHRVHWFGKLEKGGSLIVVKEKPISQKCPQISWKTTQEDIFVYK